MTAFICLHLLMLGLVAFACWMQMRCSRIMSNTLLDRDDLLLDRIMARTQIALLAGWIYVFTAIAMLAYLYYA